MALVLCRGPSPITPLDRKAAFEERRKKRKLKRKRRFGL